MLQSRNFRISLLVVAVLAILFNVWFFRPNKFSEDQHRAKAKPTWINKNEFTFHDTKGKVPGDPEQSVRLLRRIYQDMQVYRRRHGSYPLGEELRSDFSKDRLQAFREYGYASAREAWRAHIDPNAQFAASSLGSTNTVPYAMPIERPDGTKFGDPKAPGTKDMLAYGDLYFHVNQHFHIEKGERTTSNPVGFFLVLWEDGAIERIDWQKVRYLRPIRKICFPGQAGVPWERTMSLHEWEKWVVTPEGMSELGAATASNG